MDTDLSLSLGKSVMTPRELIEHWVQNPRDFSLNGLLGQIVGYPVPPDLLAELREIDNRVRPKDLSERRSLREPIIPAGYRREAAVDDPSVEDQRSSGGILVDDPASGVFVEGGDDMTRGAASASLLLAVQQRYRTNDVAFVDWEDTVDRCRAASLYGAESSSVLLNPMKETSVIVLHGVDYCAESRDGANPLGKVLRFRVAGAKKTIMTSSVAWPELKRKVGEGSGLHEYISRCISKVDGRTNVICLA